MTQGIPRRADPLTLGVVSPGLPRQPPHTQSSIVAELQAERWVKKQLTQGVPLWLLLAESRLHPLLSPLIQWIKEQTGVELDFWDAFSKMRMTSWFVLGSLKFGEQTGCLSALLFSILNFSWLKVLFNCFGQLNWKFFLLPKVDIRAIINAKTTWKNNHSLVFFFPETVFA